MALLVAVLADRPGLVALLVYVRAGDARLVIALALGRSLSAVRTLLGHQGGPTPCHLRTFSWPCHAEFSDLPGLLDRFKAARTELVDVVLADEHSWDRYVAAQWWTLRRWLDSHPGDPLTRDVQTFLDDSQREYLTYQRPYLGWGRLRAQTVPLTDPSLGSPATVGRRLA